MDYKHFYIPTMSNDTEQQYNKRKFSLVIHSESPPAVNPAITRSYNIPHPRKLESGGFKKDGDGINSEETNIKKGRRPLTGNLMMLKQPNEIPVIKVRSMSCPNAFGNHPSDSHHYDVRKYSGENNDSSAIANLKDAYNAKYVEKLKRDLLDFYNMNNMDKNGLEEEVIEEEEDNDTDETTEFSYDNTGEIQNREDELSMRLLSSCISNRSSSLTPPLEESQFEISGTTTQDDERRHSSINSEIYNVNEDQQQPLTSRSSMTSIYTTHSIVSAEGKRCQRHHHRRPSCAIKFEKPKVLEWQSLDQARDPSFGNASNDSIFKTNYSMQSYSG